MHIGNLDLEREILIIAEIGNNHEGSYTQAEEMIGLAAEAGAGAVKFQTIVPECLVSTDRPERIAQLKRFQLGYEDYEKLAKVAGQCGIMFLSTPFDLESVAFLDRLVPAFKIASGDNNFYPLLEKAARTAKPIILSSGLADLKQIRYTQALIEKRWSELNVEQELAILHCVTSYPVKPAEAALYMLARIKAATGCVVGYSDHTLGISAAVLAASLGARIIEKHFTADKNYSDFRDHQLSADPSELKTMIEQIHDNQILMGSGSDDVQDCEREAQVAARRSIAAVRDIRGGEILKWADLTWVRPGTGLPPGDESRVLGHVLKHDVAAGQIIELEMLAD